MVRAPCCEKMGLKKGPWTPEEDQILVSYIQKNGHGNWRALPKQAGLLRCGKSCRLRWINYLRPDIKRGNFSKEEEETIIQLHEMLGNRWSAIAARLPGRTDNEIKNVWHTHLKKKLNNYQSSQDTTKKQSKSTVKKSDTVKTNFTAKQENNSPDGPSAPVSPPHSSSDLSSVTADSAAAASVIPIKPEIMDVHECLTQVDKRYLSEELQGDGVTLCAENKENLIKEEVEFQFPLFSLDSNEGLNESMSRLDDDMEFWYNLLIGSEDLQDVPEI